MTAAPQTLRERLVATAASYRHTREEHRGAGREGHTRRRLEVRLDELAADFERLLGDAALEEGEREQWRRHLYHGAAEPDLPAPAAASPPGPRRPPRNKGRGSAPLWQR